MGGLQGREAARGQGSDPGRHQLDHQLCGASAAGGRAARAARRPRRPGAGHRRERLRVWDLRRLRSRRAGHRLSEARCPRRGSADRERETLALPGLALILSCEALPCRPLQGRQCAASSPDPHGDSCLKYRRFGRMGWDVSEVSFGTWAVGAEWGPVDDEQSIAAMKKALDLGVNFFDTADVYGDGRSERLLQRLRKETRTPFHVATKAGRRLRPHVAAGYNGDNLTAFIDRSLQNLGVEALELVQLHCPPTDTYYRPETFAALDE